MLGLPLRLGLVDNALSTLNDSDRLTVLACNFHRQALRQLWSSLPRDVAQSVACAVIGLRLDYCNSLYYGSSNTNNSKSYKWCITLLHELFAKLLDVNITQSTS